jgi:hypothetical protein
VIFEFGSLADIHIQKLSVIVESKLNPVHVSAGTGYDFEFETSIEISRRILANLHSAEILTPELDGDLSPGFGYFRFGKFGLGSISH